ncbi:MAG: FliM/FliN family flagellar motor switch protein [Deltaproteobacteria bacterium]|nr:FliM/FliN family flagellar motor switch protein [Deltaproteobacteria bacterium]
MINEPHDPLLSGEETEALLEAMRSSAAAGPDVATANLASPDRPLREVLGRADRCSEELTGDLRRIMLRVARCAATATADSPEILPFDVIAKSIVTGSAIAPLRTRDGSRGLVVVGPALASFVLERRLGAPLKPADVRAEDDLGGPPRPNLSSFDRRLITPFVTSLVDAFSALWSGKHDEVRLAEIVSRAQDLPASWSSSEPMIRLCLKVVAASGVADEVVIALTAGAARSASFEKSEGATATLGDRDRMAQRLAAAEVEVVAVLGRAPTTVRDLLALSVGDVVRLDRIPGRPVEVVVEGVPKLAGAPVVHHGNLAIEVSESL